MQLPQFMDMYSNMVVAVYVDAVFDSWFYLCIYNTLCDEKEFWLMARVMLMEALSLLSSVVLPFRPQSWLRVLVIVRHYHCQYMSHMWQWKWKC
jgi:hypothetical protein